MEKTVIIDGMTCAGCANTVQTRFEGVEGVSDVSVNLDAKEVTVNAANVSVDTLNNSLEGTPYSVAGEK